MAAINLHYVLFGELVKGFSRLPISNIPEDPVVVIHYRQYGELLAGLRLIFNCDLSKKDAFDADKTNDGEAMDDNDDSDKNYTEEQTEPGLSNIKVGKSLFLDIPQKAIVLDNLATAFFFLITPEKAFLDILEETKPKAVIFDAGKKLS